MPWSGRRGPVLRFVLLLAGAMCLFNAAYYVWITKSAPFERYLELNAEVSALLLRGLGESATASGTGVASPLYSLHIRDGCDAIQPVAFFVFAVAVSPVRIALSVRLVTILIGMLTLMFVNTIRIISLYYTGVYFPNLFEIMHIDVWQAAFVFLPLLFWLGWVRWASLSRRTVDGDGT